ncbi:energy-coupling factor ABC transporter substrate-binding protein [Methanothermococcus sp. Ax23]|uniref:energy-coupling factor ABC transporter substrate-binding protein n=1 Tax=Methanothermococcus sp. Ax23 TaxID=3156486 RepID=UPI003B9EB340
MEGKHIAMILGVIILTVAPLVMYAGHGEHDGYFGGSDDAGGEAIEEMNPNYHPWFHPIWEPPSGEIESLLFALQAAIGAIIIGYYIGYFKARKVYSA